MLYYSSVSGFSIRILDDGFALAKAGQVSTEQMLELVLSYSNEETYSVWASLTEVTSSPLCPFVFRTTNPINLEFNRVRNILEQHSGAR